LGARLFNHIDHSAWVVLGVGQFFRVPYGPIDRTPIIDDNGKLSAPSLRNWVSKLSMRSCIFDHVPVAFDFESTELWLDTRL
jgi:hypothetical protein